MNIPENPQKEIPNSEQNVAVVTDSVAQVPAEVARELDISVIPFTVSIDRQAYLDGMHLRNSIAACASKTSCRPLLQLL